MFKCGFVQLVYYMLEKLC